MEVDLQIATTGEQVPEAASFTAWAEAALAAIGRRADELSIRIVDEQESAELNRRYRQRDKPTNVLSFPFDAPPGVAVGWLGDLVICAAVVAREAREQHKSGDAHWAHMVVHGVLHLCGYDHQHAPEAKRMETLETGILDGLGYPDPYRED